MNGPEHYTAGDELIARLDVFDWTDPDQLALATAQIANAQAHYTAALAAATAMSFCDMDGGMPSGDSNAWIAAASAHKPFVETARSIIAVERGGHDCCAVNDQCKNGCEPDGPEDDLR